MARRTTLDLLVHAIAGSSSKTRRLLHLSNFFAHLLISVTFQEAYVRLQLIPQLHVIIRPRLHRGLRLVVPAFNMGLTRPLFTGHDSRTPRLLSIHNNLYWITWSRRSRRVRQVHRLA